MIYIVVAMDEEKLIGKNNSKNGMPWHLPEDLQHFKNTTLHKTIVMGATTYKAIGRPLPNRKTIVVTRKGLDDVRVEVASNLEQLLKQYQQSREDLYICGGASIYKQALPYVDEMLISKVPGVHTGETHFPDFEGFEVVEKTNFETFVLERYKRIER